MLPELGVLYRDHAAAIWRYARARLPTDADAEDVTSDVFARALRSGHTYDAAKGTPRAWLMGVAHHACVDWWRHRHPEEPVAQTPDRQAEDDARREPDPHLFRVLASLSDREREAIALRFGAELTSREIGHHLAISPTAARMLVHRAITKLRKEVLDV